MTLSTDADTPTAPSERIPPVRREVMVNAPAETAFAMFTAHIDRWWPLDRFSVFGSDGLVAFEDGRIVERLGDQSSVWAEVTSWDPPRSLGLTWHPGRAAERSTDLEISFEPLDDGTLVRLVHSGWERTEQSAAAAEAYGQGWIGVLSLFVAGVAATIDHGLSVVDGPGASGQQRSGDDGAAADEAPGEVGTWYALVHTPGPALDDGTSVFAHPMFGEHLAFLGRLRDRGLLVAAGPVDPERGEGMAVVRVLPEHGDVDVAELARTDDASVAGGFLQVDVRPWSVRLASG